MLCAVNGCEARSINFSLASVMSWQPSLFCCFCHSYRDSVASEGQANHLGDSARQFSGNLSFRRLRSMERDTMPGKQFFDGDRSLLLGKASIVLSTTVMYFGVLTFQL